MTVLLLLPLLSLGHAKAVSKTWDGGCGLGDITWSCANNWSDNIVPGSADTVTFNATSTNNSTVDSATFAGTITTININAGYTGTITLARSLTVSTTFSQAAGSFSGDGQTLTLAAFTLSGGSFTASSGTTSVSGAMTVSGSPTFTANGGTVNFNGSASSTLSCNSVTFNLVTFTHTAGIKTVSSNCSMPLGSNPNATSGGNITNNGVLSGSGTLTTTGGTLILGTGSSLSGFSGLVTDALTINGTYNSTFGSYTTFTVGNAFTLNSGASFTAPSGTASFSAGFTINSGATFSANGGTINFNGSTGTVSCGSKTFNAVTITSTAGTKTISSDCSLPLGANPTVGSSGTAAVVLNGTLSGSGTLTKGGSGILTLGSTGVLSGFSGLSANGLTVNGTYNFGSYSTFTVSAFTLNAGASFTAPSGTMTISGATFTISSGSTFNANGGTINFSGTTVTIICGNKTFNLVTFAATSGTKTIDNDCNLPLGANPTVGGGTAAVTVSGTLSGSGTFTMGGSNALTLNGTNSLSGFSGLSVPSALTINGTLNAGSYSTFTVGGDFNLGFGASFTAPSGTASFGSTFTINSGATFSANGGTINFNGTSTATLSCGSKTFSLVTFTHTSGTKTVSSNCNLPLGNNPNANSGGSIINNGTLSGTGTLNTYQVGGVTTLTLGSTGALSGFSGLTAYSLTVNGTYNFGSYSPFSVRNVFTMNSGAVFTAPSGTMSVNGNFTINGGTFNANGGTVNFSADSGVAKTTSCNNIVFNLVTYTNIVGRTVGGDCSMPLGNNPTMGSGGDIHVFGTITGSGTLTVPGGTFTLDSPSGILSGFTGLITNGPLVVKNTSNFGSYTTFAANDTFTLNSGAVFTAPSGTASFSKTFTLDPSSSFTANGGTVVLNGSGQTLAGNTTFYNLSKTVSSDDTLTFTAGSTTTVLGKLTLQGADAGNLLALVSSSSGSPWYIDAEGTASIGFLDVADSHSIGLLITACDSVDGGGNSGWIFNPSSCSPTHGSAATTAITNFELLQALLINQNNQSQTSVPANLPGGDDLPSKIYNFVNKFPVGKGLMKAAGQFLKVILAGLALAALIGLWLAWRHRRDQEEAETPIEDPVIITPSEIHLPPRDSRDKTGPGK